MTNPTQPKPTPIPALLVYGTPTSPDLTQASWFRAEDKPEARAAAESLKFSVIDIQTEAERALLVGVHEGVLKGSGRMIVGSVSSEVYRRIEVYARKAAGVDASARSASTETDAKRSATEQTMNLTVAETTPSAPTPKSADPTSTVIKLVTAASSSASPPSRPDKTAPPAASPAASPSAKSDGVPTDPDPWNSLRVGSHVVAKHWEEDGEPYGWWIGKVIGFEKDEFVVVWLDYPSKMPPFRIERKNVAILHPAFDLKTERERKRR